MKYLIILGDGMADEPVAELGGRTPLQAARTPAMDRVAASGASGLLDTVHGCGDRTGRDGAALQPDYG